MPLHRCRIAESSATDCGSSCPRSCADEEGSSQSSGAPVLRGMVLTIHILSDRTLPISRPSARAAPLLPRSGFVQCARRHDLAHLLLQSRQANLCRVDHLMLILENDLLCWMIEGLLRQPALPGRQGCYHPCPPQIRTRQFPASGSSRESFADDVMDDRIGRSAHRHSLLGQTFSVSRQFGYPCRIVDTGYRVQSPPSVSRHGPLIATPPFPPSGPSEPGSPLSQVL